MHIGFSKATVSLIGRIGNMDLKYSKAGNAIAEFSIAVDKWNPSTKKSDTMWVNVVDFGESAEKVAASLGKGALVGVDGDLSIEKYQAQDGGNRFATKVIARNIYPVVGWNKDGVAAAAGDDEDEWPE